MQKVIVALAVIVVRELADLVFDYFSDDDDDGDNQDDDE